MIAICSHYCVKWFGNPFYFTVNQCDCDTSEHSVVNGKTPSVNFKNRKQVVFVIIPFENHIVGSCTNNAYRDQPKSKIVYMLLVDAGFSASVYRQSKAKHHTTGDNDSVPSDIQPFNSEKIFYCISVPFLVAEILRSSQSV